MRNQPHDDYDMEMTENARTFRDIFKYYKRKDRAFNLDDVFDCHNLNSKFKDDVRIVEMAEHREKFDWESNFGMKNPSQWKVFEFKGRPGLMLISNPFTCYGQRYWTIRCLQDFTKKPNHLNIDAHDLIEQHEDWWEFCCKENDTEHGSKVLNKLRWATMGYHHDWDTKVYTEAAKTQFPCDLKALCKEMANMLGFTNFNAEAAIVNFYHIDSSLSGHTDHSEANLNAPLFSFSLGQSAVFLIGGTHKENEPIPLLLESGDVVVMSKESRLCYHGVPRILLSKKKPWECCQNEVTKNQLSSNYLLQEVVGKVLDHKLWQPFKYYVNRNRINMNVRQVLFQGQVSLENAYNS